MYSSGSYTECTVKKTPNKTLRVITSAIYILVPIVAIVCLGIKQSIQNVLFYGIPIVGVTIIVALLIDKYLFKVDYDYTLLDDTFGVDEIRGGSLRRNVLSVEMKEIRAFVPFSKKEKVENINFKKIINYASSPDSNEVYYLSFVKNESEQYLCVLEPSEEMVQMLQKNGIGVRS